MNRSADPPRTPAVTSPTRSAHSHRTDLALAAVALLALGAGECSASERPAAGPTAPADEPPPGVEQILPRGGIPAVFEPRFVAASEAEIPGDAWVLGVEIDGVAKAYSLNLLNRHEVVNDSIGERDFAAVW